MPFDAVSWGEGVLVPAIAYQPSAGNGTDVWFSALVAAHAKARRYGRLAVSYGWPWNGIADNATGFASRLASNSYQTIGLWDAYVEATWNYATVYLLCSCAAATESYVYTQLQIYDGATSVTTTQILTVPTSAAPRIAPTIWDVDARTDNNGRLVVTLESALSAFTLDQDLRFTLSASATDELGALPTGTAVSLNPNVVVIMLECRG